MTVERNKEMSQFELLLEMSKLSRQLDELGGAVGETNSAISVSKREIKALEEEATRKRREQHDMELAVYDANKQLKVIKRNMEYLQSKLDDIQAAKAWADEYARLAGKLDKLAEGFEWYEKIKPHQIEGAKKLVAAKRGLCFDKMRLGKSILSLAWADLLGIKKLLIIVPNEVQSNFKRELTRWASKRPSIILGGKVTKRERKLFLSNAQYMPEVTVIINYEAWRRDKALIEQLIACKFEAVIVDEAHMIKERSTSAYQGVSQIVHANNQCPNCGGDDIGFAVETGDWSAKMHCDTCDYFSKEFFDFCSIKNILPMTGSPILNKPQDLYTLLNLVRPVEYPSEYEFLSHYCQQNQYTGRWEFKSGGLERLVKELSHIIVMRDAKSAGVEITPQDIQYHDIDFDHDLYPKQSKLLKDLNQALLPILESEGKLPILYQIALITRKRQAITWPQGITIKNADGAEVFHADCDESIKLDHILMDDGETGLLAEMIDGGMVHGQRVVIASQFATVLAELDRRCKVGGISAIRYDGSTPDDVKEQVKLDFDYYASNLPGYEKKWQVCLMNYKTGGVGISLADADGLIIVDEEWNPGSVTRDMPVFST